MALSSTCLNYSETLDNFKIDFSTSYSQLLSYEDYIEFLSYVNERDSCCLNLNINSEQGIIFKTDKYPTTEMFSEFMEILDEDDKINFHFIINKKIIQNKISIYLPDKFLEWLKNKNFENTCLFYCKLLKNAHIEFELQNKETIFLKTNFININTCSDINIDISTRSSIIQKLVRHNSFTDYNMIPEDFNVIENSGLDDYKAYFNKIKTCLSLIYLTNYHKIENNYIHYGFEGNYFYEDTLDYDSVIYNEILYELYLWIYKDSNNYEKLILTRNIISMNCNTRNSISSIDSTLFDTILTNFILYENENVKNYIELKKQIADCIIENNHRIQDMVSHAIDRFKNNMVALLTIIIASILPIFEGQEIQNSFIILLTFIFSLFYIAICIIEYFLNKNSVKQSYNNLKELYSDILSAGDSNSLFAKDKLDKNIKYSRHIITILILIWIIILFIIYNYFK